MRYAFAPLPALAGGDPYFLFDPRTGRALLDRIETAGYETALLDAGAGVIDNIDVVAIAARWNTALDLVMPHWTGTYSPVMAANDIAALDAHCDGRLQLLLMPDDRIEGYVGRTQHLRAWQRLDEYLKVMRRLWASDQPFDHIGEHYAFSRAYVAEKGPRGGAIPLRIRGRSGIGIRTAARHADVFEIEASSRDEVASLADRLRLAARDFGREDRISLAAVVSIVDLAAPQPAAVAAGRALGLASIDEAAFLADYGIDEIIVAAPIDTAFPGIGHHRAMASPMHHTVAAWPQPRTRHQKH